MKSASLKQATKATARTNGNWQGMNWIRQEKRLAIYLRDGLSCCYCGQNVEDGIKLTLDHLVPHSKNGSNHETNLVTACVGCNSSRGNRPLATFVKAVAVYRNHGAKAQDILNHVRNCAARKLNKSEALDMIARRNEVSLNEQSSSRGSVAKALAGMM